MTGDVGLGSVCPAFRDDEKMAQRGEERTRTGRERKENRGRKAGGIPWHCGTNRRQGRGGGWGGWGGAGVWPAESIAVLRVK